MGMKSPSSAGSHQEDPSQATQPSQEQIEILAAFRSELESEGHLQEGETLGTDDETLLRFLRARRFNLAQAKRMITQCLSWRHQVEGVGIDDLYREVDPFDFPQKEHVFKYWPMYYHRTDKLGRPINIQRFGSLDLSKLYAVVDKEAHFRSIIVNCESLTREILPACTHRKLLNQQASSGLGVEGCNGISVELPPNFVKITNAFCIIDLKGFSLTQFWQIKSIARICFSISQDYYPETMGYLAIINAPMSFATIFKAVQPWLSKDTISKINILGEDYATTLLKYVDPENLPNYLGGQCECNTTDLGKCDYKDPNFEQSPWLCKRDWKGQSWQKFGLQGQEGQGQGQGERRTRREEQDEVEVDGNVTSDGALIITRNKKSSQDTVDPATATVQDPVEVTGVSTAQETSQAKPTSESTVAPAELVKEPEPKPAGILSNPKTPSVPSDPQPQRPLSTITNPTDTSASLFTARSEPPSSQDNSSVHA